jgi:catechol O-methyltransferase
LGKQAHLILVTAMLGSNHPFATAFGDDDDDDASEPPTQPIRDRNNGVLSFHHGTEYALLAFVQQEIHKFSQSEASETSSAEIYHDSTVNRKLVQGILQSIDQFCTERHWMMHVGPQKGCIVQDFLKERLQHHFSLYQHERTFNVVELGTYCGYSTVRLVDTLLQRTTNFHVYTVDVNSQTQNVARQLIALAGFEKYVTFVLRDQNSPTLFVEQLSNSMAGKMNISEDTSVGNGSLEESHHKSAPMIHFLFVDHAKELYLSDVQLLAANHFIQRDTAIAADNVVFFQLTDYRQYMMSLQAKGIVRTKLISDGIFLEYSNVPSPKTGDASEPRTNADVCDGLGTRILGSIQSSHLLSLTLTLFFSAELTVFLKDHVLGEALSLQAQNTTAF